MMTDSDEKNVHTIVLENAPAVKDRAYQDTPLPFIKDICRPQEESVPAQIRQLRRLFGRGRESLEQKAQSFYRQGMFMEDYEDDAPWPGNFFCFFPTYQTMSVKQLRGYFSWRTGVRNGEWRPIDSSAAYLYIFELLNGIGAGSPEDTLQKLKSFEEGFLDSGIGNPNIRPNLRRWMMEYAVLQGLPSETARRYADPGLIGRDRGLAALRSPEQYPDEEVFEALCCFGPKSPAASPVVTGFGQRGMRLFADSWKRAAAGYSLHHKDLFTLCFGERVTGRWYPLANAVYYHKRLPRQGEYALDESRTFRYQEGTWKVEAYEPLFFDRRLFQGFLQETDRRLRLSLKTGRYLRERPENAWAAPFVLAAIEEDRRVITEAARPKITIDLSELDQIRRDALITRDSLLTEEDRKELESLEVQESPETLPSLMGELPLDEIHIRILLAILRGDSVKDLIQTNHLMPSVVADTINEALFDEIGDTVLLCEDDSLSLIEDYREDLIQLLGGTDT